MDLWPRQRELVLWLLARIAAREDGLVEKSRDIGFNWVVGGVMLHHWLFKPGFKAAFGSRKQEFVDERGNADSIFEKLRMMLSMVPRWMWPTGYGDAHDNYMRLVNPETGGALTGEAGDNMGRGGRNKVYILDEAAFMERADKVDMATSANADTRIFGSSVNGMGNMFATKRFGGTLQPHQIFRFHWSDDIRKTPEWAAKKRASMDDWKWASEYDIDYSASVEGICIPAKWVESSLRLRDLYDAGKITVDLPRRGVAGLDVGAGKAKSVFIARFGPVAYPPEAWGSPDTTETAHKALAAAKDIVITRPDKFECRVTNLNYDSVGVGHDVQYTLKNTPKGGIVVNPINTGNPPSDSKWPDGETSEQKFVNMKAEAWWKMRARFKAAHEHYQWMTKTAATPASDCGREHRLSDLIILPAIRSGKDAQVLVGQLSLPKYFRSEKGKIQIESKKDMQTRGLPSPDHADALALCECTNPALSSWEKLAEGG